MGHLYVPQYKSVTVRVEWDKVQLIEAGQMILELPWQAARDLSRALRAQSGRAEANAKIDQVIKDQAVLVRAGFPIALDPRPDVFHEAGKEAAHSRELRRSMPGSIPSGVVFGVPAVRAGKPPKARIGATGIPSGERMGNIGGR